MLGAVLAGGRSSRFGSDKAAALLAGRPLIEHAAAAIAPWVDRVIVCGRDWPGFDCVADHPSSDLGPLGGIAAAIHLARREGYEAVLTIGCDMPTIDGDLLAELTMGGSRWCEDAPLLGCWQAALAGSLDAHLARGGDRSVRGWARSVEAMPVSARMPVVNVNTPADLAAL